jgi:hypothetical protein
MQAVVYQQPFYLLLANIFPIALLRGASRVFVVSHELPLDEAPSAYQEFDQGNGWLHKCHPKTRCRLIAAGGAAKGKRGESTPWLHRSRPNK